MKVTASQILSLSQYLPNKQSDFGRYLLPSILLCRLDELLKETKVRILDALASFEDGTPVIAKSRAFQKISGRNFYNVSRLDLASCLSDPSNLKANLNLYIQGFDDDTRDVFEKFSFQIHLDSLDEENTLYIFFKELLKVDLSLKQLSNQEMAKLYEEMIRQFAELSNETAGKRFTPRDVIALMVELIFSSDTNRMNSGSLVRTCFDPACGTGGMLNLSEEYFSKFPSCNLIVHGEEMDKETYAICKALRIIGGLDSTQIKRGDSFSEDFFSGQKFDYIFSNPPFGESWKYSKDFVINESQRLGHAGRFGAGYPEVGDGIFLFIQHILSKFKSKESGGSRAALITNGSPLFSAASNSEPIIRKHLLENDYVEAIIRLPSEMFYSTPIETYIRILNNNKVRERIGKVQLINAINIYTDLKKNIGKKNKVLLDSNIKKIIQGYLDFSNSSTSKIFDSKEFGYTSITIERPMRDNSGNIIYFTKGKNKGRPQPDSDKRDFENVPLTEVVEEYFKREVLPHIADAWIDESKSKVGYEIPFTRHFYESKTVRSIKKINDDIECLLEEIVGIYANNKVDLKKVMRGF